MVPLIGNTCTCSYNYRLITIKGMNDKPTTHKIEAAHWSWVFSSTIEILPSKLYMIAHEMSLGPTGDHLLPAVGQENCIYVKSQSGFNFHFYSYLRITEAKQTRSQFPNSPIGSVCGTLRYIPVLNDVYRISSAFEDKSSSTTALVKHGNCISGNQVPDICPFVVLWFGR